MLKSIKMKFEWIPLIPQLSKENAQISTMNNAVITILAD